MGLHIALRQPGYLKFDHYQVPEWLKEASLLEKRLDCLVWLTFLINQEVSQIRWKVADSLVNYVMGQGIQLAPELPEFVRQSNDSTLRSTNMIVLLVTGRS